MIKILVYGMNPKVGGVEEYLMNLYRNMEIGQVEMHFVVEGQDCIYEEEIKRLGGSVHYITPKVNSMIKNMKEHYQLIKASKKEMDAAYLNLSVLYYNVVFKFLRWHRYKHIIVHAHNVRSKQMNKIYDFMHRWNRKKVAKESVHKWACSKEAGEWIFGKKVSRSGKVELIPNAIECRKYQYNPELREKLRKEMGLEDKWVIGNIGRLSYQKNQTFLLEIFAEIQKQVPEAKLMLVGDGEELENLKQKVRTLGIKEDVLFLGSRRDVPDLLQVMDVFVIPSHFEGFGIVLVEAQSAGLKIYASDTIPNSSKVTDLVEYLSLENTPQEWAKQIIDGAYSYERENQIEHVKEAGYDIGHLARAFEEFANGLADDKEGSEARKSN